MGAICLSAGGALSLDASAIEDEVPGRTDEAYRQSFRSVITGQWEAEEAVGYCSEAQLGFKVIRYFCDCSIP